MKRQFLFCFSCAVTLALNFSCSKDYGYLFDNGYSSGEYTDTVSVAIDTNRFKVDYSKYTQARVFPGLIGDKEPRLENHKVTVDLNFDEIRSSDLRISVAPGNWQSTSMYAPAGELVVIEVPAGIYGLTAQIGAHTDNSATGIPAPQRDLQVASRQVLFPGKNYMRNLYGGLIYILPSSPLGRTADLLFSGAAQAPSFKLGELTDAQWLDMISKSSVPWFELEGKRMVLTLETAKLKKFPLLNPTALMTKWDEMIQKAYWDWTGMTEGNPDVRHRAPFNKWRIVHEVLFKAGVAQSSGYPVHARNSDEYFRQATSLQSVMTQNWGTYHELGHNMQQNNTWNFDGNGEVTNNLFSFKMAWVNGQQHTKIAEVWPTGFAWVTYSAPIGNTDATKTKTWANMETISRNHNDAKLIMYAQIFEKYGYEFMTYLYTRARNARFTSANNQSKIDFFYEALCEYTKIDMEPFLSIGWGIKVSDVSKRYVVEELKLPLLNQYFWLYNPVTHTGGENAYYPELPKTGWVATASNNQTDASNTYVPSKMLDGDISTFWSSCWNSTCSGEAFSSPTWTVTVQTGANGIVANGIALSIRQLANNANHFKKFSLELSEDNVSWQSAGTHNMTRDLFKQYFFFNSGTKELRTFKYARIRIDKADLFTPTDYASIAEIGFINVTP